MFNTKSITLSVCPISVPQKLKDPTAIIKIFQITNPNIKKIKNHKRELKECGAKYSGKKIIADTKATVGIKTLINITVRRLIAFASGKFIGLTKYVATSPECTSLFINLASLLVDDVWKNK